VLRAPGYLRYVDDFALSHAIVPTTGPATFLGMVLVRPRLRRLPEENVARFRNRLRGLRDRWRAGSVTDDDVKQRVRSWIAHAEHADTWQLRHAIFRGGRLDPALADLCWRA
jgi:hypothetical protein